MIKSRKRFRSALLILLGCACWTGAFAAKGGKPGTEPPPPLPPLPTDGAACQNSERPFPAMAYVREVASGTFDYILANSDGSCSVPVFRSSGFSGEISYRQEPSEAGASRGRIILKGGEGGGTKRQPLNFPVITSLHFTVENQVITGELPLTEERIYRHPVGVGAWIPSIALGPDVDSVFFTLQDSGGLGAGRTSLNLIDLSSCSVDCPLQQLSLFDNRGLGGLSVNPSGTRIYGTGPYYATGVHAVAFVEKDANGQWSGLKDVVTNSDSGYSDSVWGNGELQTSVALLDLSGTGNLSEVLAFNREAYDSVSFDVMDVQGCDPTIVGTSCLQDHPNAFVQVMLPGFLLSFTSVTSLQDGDGKPHLLTYSLDSGDACDAGNYCEVDPLSRVRLNNILAGVPAVWLDSAD
jgi:hypothetical protein